MIVGEPEMRIEGSMRVHEPSVRRERLAVRRLSIFERTSASRHVWRGNGFEHRGAARVLACSASIYRDCVSRLTVKSLAARRTRARSLARCAKNRHAIRARGATLCGREGVSSPPPPPPPPHRVAAAAAAAAATAIECIRARRTACGLVESFLR